VFVQAWRFIIFHETHGAHFQPKTRVGDIEESSKWIFDNLFLNASSSLFLLDFNLGVYYSYFFAVHFNETFRWNTYNERSYKFIINQESFDEVEIPWEYVIIDHFSSKSACGVLGVEWVYFTSFRDYFSEIFANPHLKSIYSDDFVWIFSVND
jgi:hypothetical protein